jgi:hypothetical protein
MLPPYREFGVDITSMSENPTPHVGKIRKRAKLITSFGKSRIIGTRPVFDIIRDKGKSVRISSTDQHVTFTRIDTMHPNRDAPDGQNMLSSILV